MVLDGWSNKRCTGVLQVGALQAGFCRTVDAKSASSPREMCVSTYQK
jgi:hypothetical protein